MNKVYIALSADVIHHGHINLINNAKKYGSLVVGLLTDKAIVSFKRMPLLNYQQRKKILENINGISKIVPQNEWEYSKNLLKIRPNIMVHGDDWKFGPDKILRAKTINTLKKINAKLIEIPYTKDISSTAMQQRIYEQGISPYSRQQLLKRLIDTKGFVRILETHSPLSAIIVEKTFYKNKSGKKIEFDGFWSSSLTDSTLRGKPDIEVLDINERLKNINSIFDVTTKPMIVDIDTGGKNEHFQINIKTIDRNGISAVIMEDKKGLKKNSLFGLSVKQQQENPLLFKKKIELGKKHSSDNLMIIARIESLIFDKPIKDALDRADKYLQGGADGIMIHSKDRDPKKIFQFIKMFRKKFLTTPLVVVPSSFNQVKEKTFLDLGVNVVIYANHLLRASYPAMRDTAMSILKNSRSLEADRSLLGIKEILELIPGTK
jgi:phosphoenolpyruvate mutase